MTVQLASNQFGQVDSIKLADNIDGLVIKHQYCQAKISLHGGQVLMWQPIEHQPVFWLSKSSSYQQDKAIRGGIPLCWPWFGSHHNDPENKAGNHGFARQQTWQVESIAINDNDVVVKLMWQGENMHDLFPIACQIKQTLVFGEKFSQQFEMINLTESEITYTGALHSYFSVSDPKQIKIAGLSALKFADKLTGEMRDKEVFINGVGPVDRIYHIDNADNRTMCLVDEGLRRTIKVVAENTQQWVFWNPGEQLASNMADIHNQGEQEFVCLEAANTQPQMLPAHSSTFISQTIEVFSNN